MHQFGLLKEKFIVDYALSQIIANIVVFYIKYRNPYYLVSVHNVFAVTIILVAIYKYPFQNKIIGAADKLKSVSESTSTKTSETSSSEEKTASSDNKTSSPKNSKNGTKDEKKGIFARLRDMVIDAFLFIVISGSLSNVISDYYSKRNDYNKNSHYFHLFEANLRLAKPSFNALLYLSNAEFTFIDIETARTYNSIFFIKFISLFVILFMGRIIYIHRHQTKIEEKKLQKNQHHNDIERVKNYLLEDFLEENHIKMNELSNYEIEFNKELEILKTLNYDYELYKSEKTKSFEDDEDEKINFLNDIKKLREQINQNKNDKRNNATKCDVKSPAEKILKRENSQNIKKEKIDKKQQSNKDESTAKAQTSFISTSPLTPIVGIEAIFTIRPHYLYNIMQLLFLFLITALAMKIKYILTPFLCLMSSTFPPKNWFPQKNSLIYWIVMTVLLVCGIMDPGLSNIKNQYKHEEYSNAKFEQLLKWIDTNTDRNAVFAGPIDVTSSILLVNRRPIVNHAHHELSEME